MSQHRTPKPKKKGADPRWEAIRPHRMREWWFGHVVALELNVDALEQALDPKAGTHVSRLKRTPEATRETLEATLEQVEKICRHMRMENQHDGERNMKVVMPFLTGLEQAPSIQDDLRARHLNDSPHVSTQRMRTVDTMRHVIRDYANAIGQQVTRDSLYNAYRMDFHGMQKEKFEAHPFIDLLPETSSILRRLALARNMQRLARRLTEDSDPVIADAASRFAHQLDGMESSYDPRLKDWLVCLSDPKSPAEQRAKVKAEAAPWLQERAQMIVSRFDRKSLLDAYKVDEADYVKPRSATPPTKADLLDKTGKARESLTQLSYLRAEAALKRLDAILEMQWRAVEQLYPDPNAKRGQLL